MFALVRRLARRFRVPGEYLTSPRGDQLTDRFIRVCKALPTGWLIMTDTVVRGLSVRINPANSRNPEGLLYWLFRYRLRAQAQRSIVLGPYPTLSLADVDFTTATALADFIVILTLRHAFALASSSSIIFRPSSSMVMKSEISCG